MHGGADKQEAAGGSIRPDPAIPILRIFSVEKSEEFYFGFSRG